MHSPESPLFAFGMALMHSTDEGQDEPLTTDGIGAGSRQYSVRTAPPETASFCRAAKLRARIKYQDIRALFVEIFYTYSFRSTQESSNVL
jgi:hypothetical protein